MPFKQIRAFIVRHSPRASKVQQLNISAPAVQGNDQTRPPQFDRTSVSDWIDEDDSSWNGEAPDHQLPTSAVQHSNHRPPAAMPSQSSRGASPTPQGRAPREMHVPEGTHLRILDHELAEQLERAEQDLSRKHVVMAEMEDDLNALWETATRYKEDNAHLTRLVDVLATSRWRPTRRLKQRLVDVEARARLAEGQIARMKEVLADQVKHRRDLRDEAYELWDAILKTGEQAGALDRADRAMNRLSIRFDFEGSLD